MQIPNSYLKEIEALKKEVLQANLLLQEYKLVIHTWGNVSGITKDRKFMVIKPSGVSYKSLTADDMVVVDLDNNVYSSNPDQKPLKPSSDTPTHTLLYKSNQDIWGIVHTHSTYATMFAQAGKSIPVLGTTHADNFYNQIICTRALTEAEIEGEYEHNTGLVILENKQQNFLPSDAILVREHGPFAWSKKGPIDAADLALTLEQIAKLAYGTIMLQNADAKFQANKFLIEKHFKRKHGPKAYYGQK